MKKYYKLTSLNEEEQMEWLVVATDYADAINKAVGLVNFDYLFGEGFKIIYAGEIVA